MSDRNLPAQLRSPDARSLLERILDTPNLAQVVPQLQPELLHRVIEHCGLEDCSEIVALTTPEQLARVFDLDLWRPEEAGLDEQFDAARFGVWLEVLLETGAVEAARKVAAMESELVIAGLAQHSLVYDLAAITSYETTDGEQIVQVRPVDTGLSCDCGGYHLVARRADSWSAIVEVLTALEAGHPEYFHHVMSGCRALSNSGFEVDGLNNLLPETDQVMFDLSADREERREKQGYVSPAQARAFLQMSRDLRRESEAMPLSNPLAHAYFQAMDSPATTDPESSSSEAEVVQAEGPAEAPAEAVASVIEVLLDAGIIAPPPRALLSGGETHAPRLNHIQSFLEFALDQNPSAYVSRDEELAYLANALIAGCSIQGRSFTAQEASDAAIAVCNLGLENWPSHWLPRDLKELPISFLVDHQLVPVFQVGWKVLHEDVSMYSAEQLVRVLKNMRCDDVEIQRGLDELRVEMARDWKAGAPWRSRLALDVIAILDLPAWAVLLALIDECPTLHPGIRASLDSRILSVRASDFEFISENSQIEDIQKFMESLPETLRR